MEMSNFDKAFINLVNDILESPKQKGGNYCVINALDGTVTELENSYVVNLNTLKPEAKALWEEWLESGSDSFVRDLAIEHGFPLTEIVDLKGI